jgi:hypothetical protein
MRRATIRAPTASTRSGMRSPRARLVPCLDERKRADQGTRGLRTTRAQVPDGGGVSIMADYTPNEMMTVACGPGAEG